MNEALIVLEQVSIIMLLMAIGYISIKLKIMTVPWYEGVGKFTIYIALPALIFRTITSLGGRSAVLGSIPAVVASIALILINFGVGKFVARISGLKGRTADTHLSATAMGNLGYIGLPMVAALYGNDGLLILSVFMIFDVMLNWTVGINFMNQDKNQPVNDVLRGLITPLNVTLVASVTLLMLNIKPSGLVFDVISGLGSTTKYCSIVYLGAMLTVVDFKGAHKQVSLYFHTLVRLFLFPILVYMVGRNFLDPVVAKTLAIIMALPTMPSFPIFAKVKGGDEQYAVKVTFVGTLVALVTIPLVVGAMSMTWI